MEIQRLRSGDGEQLREVRLRALSDAPYAFSSSLQREAAHGPEYWNRRAAESESGDAGAVFVAADCARALGMAGGFFADGERDTAVLWGMWVDPRARRAGLGQQLVEAVAAWAQESGAGRLRLAVTDCEASKPASGLYRKLGFAETGEREPLEWNPSLTARVLSRPL